MNTVTSTSFDAGLLRGLKLDGWLLVWLLLLMLLGLVVLYSASGGREDVLLYQVSRLVIGLGAMLVLAQMRPEFLVRAAPWVYGLVLALLVLVLLIGEEGGGARRWLDFGVRFQPSEFAKLAVPLALASILGKSKEPPGVLMTAMALLLICLPVALVLRQPDLGTAVVLCGFGLITLLLAGLHRRFIYGGALIGVLAIPALWVSLRDYQRQRILSVLNPESDPLGAGYHIIQSKIAIGSGGAFGKGLDAEQPGAVRFSPRTDH